MEATIQKYKKLWSQVKRKEVFKSSSSKFWPIITKKACQMWKNSMVMASKMIDFLPYLSPKSPCQAT